MPDAVDDIDITILQLLNENARIANAEIARRVGLAPTAIFQRIRKLETAGVVRGYTATIDPRSLGFGLMAFVTIQTNEHARDHDTAALLAAIPEVREVHRVVGEDCFFIKVRVTGTAELAMLLDEQIRRIPSVRGTRTTIVLKTSKDADGPPLERLAPQS